MLIVKILNDGSVRHPKGNYDYEVSVTKYYAGHTSLEVIEKGHIEGFDRREGWKSLVRKVCNDQS